MTRISIIIPTYNRPNYLRRILDYYDSFQERKDDFKIIVADSSSNENKLINQEVISSLKNFEVSYLGDYPEKINPYYKFVDALNYVKTKYCLFCADDDFATPNGINQSVNFLEQNLDFTVAHGFYIYFQTRINFWKKLQFFWRPIYPYESITFSSPKQRLLFHFDNYCPTIYGVHQTDFLKMIFRETLKFINDERFGELLPSMLSLIYGKMKCLDVLYAAREAIPESGGSSFKNINDFIREGSYDEKCNNFKNCLAGHLSKVSQLEIEESKKIIDKVMALYLKKSYPSDWKYILINKMKNLLDYLPPKISERIRFLYTYSKLTFPKQQNTLFDDGDFNKIRNCVISHTEIYGK